MKPLRYLFVILIAATLAFANFSIGKALTSSLVEVTGFGDNPSSLRMYVYIPTSVKPNPPILVAVHYCTGSGPAMFNGTQFAALADQYGYIVVYPSVTRSGGCFDVSSSEALTRGGGSDPVGIMSMVTYAAQHYNGDLNQVYVTGISSGAMMTNVLLGDYPDVFKAGAAFAGVPFGCFGVNASGGWSSACATGTVTHTPQEWGDIARAAYPGYTGARPRVQLWHGSNDEVLSYVNFGEAIKQWTNVHGVSQTPTSTDSPATGQTRTRYANSSGTVVVEAISLQGVSHNLPVDAAAAIHFFGLDGSSTPTTVTPTTVTPTTVTPTTAVPTTATPGSCRVTYTANGWSNGFTADIKITNYNTSPINGWTLTYSYASGQQITSAWNATVTQSGANVTASNPSGHWNGTISANGGSVSFGVQGSYSGNNTVPNNFSLNGVACGGTATPTTAVPTTVVPTTAVPTTVVPTTIVPTTAVPTTPGTGICSPVTATITPPFTFDGAGTHCWRISMPGSYINSWNLASLTINGVDFTNTYVTSGAYPAAIDGYWYISYTGNYTWSHFEIK